MHSSIGAWEEANLLYVGQSRLNERLLLAERAPLVIYDIGMGIAANALAAIACAEAHPPEARRELHLVSFERDLDGLRVARSHSGHFPFFGGRNEALDTLIRTGRWTAPGITWELRAGDFREQILGNPEPEVIFYDFYSPRSVDAALWGEKSFARLFAASAGRRSAGKAVMLSTYSSATAARAAMLLSGFYVGRGKPTSLKSETTIASARLEDLEAPLGSEWLAKFERSSKALPADCAPEDAEALRARVRGAAQFGPTSGR